MEPSLQKQQSSEDSNKYVDAEKEENDIIEKNVDQVRKSLGENVEESQSPLKIYADNVHHFFLAIV